MKSAMVLIRNYSDKIVIVTYKEVYPYKVQKNEFITVQSKSELWIEKGKRGYIKLQIQSESECLLDREFIEYDTFIGIMPDKRIKVHFESISRNSQTKYNKFNQESGCELSSDGNIYDVMQVLVSEKLGNHSTLKEAIINTISLVEDGYIRYNELIDSISKLTQYSVIDPPICPVPCPKEDNLMGPNVGSATRY